MKNEVKVLSEKCDKQTSHSNKLNLANLSKYICFALVGFSSIASAAQQTTTDLNEQDKRNEARAHAKELGSNLKTRLQEAIKRGGLEAGVEECKLVAEPIAHSLSNEGWTVGRTALRVRNPNNKPDDWETAQLIKFAEQLSENVTGLLEATHVDGKTGEFRYMKAITTGQVCTACHGKQVAPSVLSAIKKAYPEDEATGFKPGSLRGAFTLKYSPTDAE